MPSIAWLTAPDADHLARDVRRRRPNVPDLLQIRHDRVADDQFDRSRADTGPPDTRAQGRSNRFVNWRFEFES